MRQVDPMTRNGGQLQLTCRTILIIFMVTLNFGLLALVHPFPGVPRSSIESRTHAGVLTPGIHITGCALEHRWTASRYGEASFVLKTERREMWERRGREEFSERLAWNACTRPGSRFFHLDSLPLNF